MVNRNIGNSYILAGGGAYHVPTGVLYSSHPQKDEKPKKTQRKTLPPIQAIETLKKMILFCEKRGYLSDDMLGSTSQTRGSGLEATYKVFQSSFEIPAEHRSDEEGKNSYFAIAYENWVYEFHCCADGKYGTKEMSILEECEHDLEEPRTAEYLFIPKGSTESYLGDYTLVSDKGFTYVPAKEVGQKPLMKK